MTTEIEIFVFGSCQFSEKLEDDTSVGIGGYGVVITADGKQIDQISRGFASTTNARMDIMGIIEGLKKLTTPSEVIVYLSNGYVIDTLTKGWLNKWEKNNYKKKKHADLWKELSKLLKQGDHDISFEHSRDVRQSLEFQLAEKLGKMATGKKHLPVDLQSEGHGLFEPESPLQPERQMKPVNLEPEDDLPDLDSICVDASSIGNPGKTEYRGVDTKTRKVIFQHKYEEATNNIGEFLGIVHALALYKSRGEVLRIIYSDSATAISWVKQKKCKTKYARTAANAKLFDDIQRAVAWLGANQYETKVLKWNTGVWGEIPADYGRKR